jgi:hypothetical protein
MGTSSTAKLEYSFLICDGSGPTDLVLYALLGPCRVGYIDLILCVDGEPALGFDVQI